jgi:hypothetical protein
VKARPFVVGAVAAATAVAIQLSGMGAAFADPVSAATVAAAQADADRALKQYTDAQAAADKAAARAADAAAQAAAEAAKAALLEEKAQASGKAEDRKKADDAAARAASFAAKAAELEAEATAKAADAAAKRALSDGATVNAQREAASFAAITPGTSVEGPGRDDDVHQFPSNANHSDNVKVISNTQGIRNHQTALNFMHYDNLGYDIMVGNGTGGLSVWSLKDPANPQYISGVSAEAMMLPGDTQARFWEGENLTVDPKRKLAFLTRDPRGFGGSVLTGKSGLIIIDLKDPWNPVLRPFHPVPAGHTATCINDCRYVWSMGPANNGGHIEPGWKAVPVYVTDVRDINHPYTFSKAVDTDRNDGTTDYVHSADVDFNGVVWTSGYGGVRGYWTEGKHYDPVAKVTRWATAYDPIPYAGGFIPNPSGIAHNAFRQSARAVGSVARGDLLLVTEENNTSNCNSAGKFVLASIAGSYDGQSWNSTPENPFRIQRLGHYTPTGKPGTESAAGDCSAHWFTVKGNIVAIGMYGHGTRFLDVSDPMNIKQVGHFVVPANASQGIAANNSWAAYFHGDYVYVADTRRGVDVIQFTGDIPGKVESKVCWNACDK